MKLVPIDPTSPIAAMGPLRPPPPRPPAGGAVASGGGDDQNPRREPAPIPPDAIQVSVPVENINAALAKQQASRAKDATKDALGHATLAVIQARNATFLAAKAAWHTLLYKGPAMTKTGTKIAYDVFVKVVADIIREVMMGGKR
jgi:hypothetical protein